MLVIEVLPGHKGILLQWDRTAYIPAGCALVAGGATGSAGSTVLLLRPTLRPRTSGAGASPAAAGVHEAHEVAYTENIMAGQA